MAKTLEQKVQKLADQQPVELKTKEYDFLSLQSPEFQEIYYLYLDLKAAESTDPEIEEAISIRFQNFWKIPEAAAKKLSKNMCMKFSDQSFMTRFLDEKNGKQTCSNNLNEQVEEEETPKAFLTSLDYERFVQFTSVDPDASVDLKAALLSFIINYRRNYHKSGWIKYERKNILYLANLLPLALKAQNDILGKLHNDYGLEMRVVGSNNPTPCYKIDWLFDQPQPGSHFNPFIELGPLCPDSIRSAASGALKIEVFKNKKNKNEEV